MLRNKRIALFLRNPDGDGNGSGDGKVTFTAEQQAYVDKLVGDTRVKGREVALADFLKTLGVENADALKAALDEGKKLKDAQKSELEKAQQAANDAQAKIEAAEKAKTDALAQAQTKLLRAAVIAEAVKQNFDEAEISSVWLALQQDKTLLEGIKTKKDSDDEFEGVAQAVEAIAKAHPKWLKTADAQKTNINAQNRSAGKKETDAEREEREKELRARFGIRKQ